MARIHAPRQGDGGVYTRHDQKQDPHALVVDTTNIHWWETTAQLTNQRQTFTPRVAPPSISPLPSYSPLSLFLIGLLPIHLPDMCGVHYEVAGEVRVEARNPVSSPRSCRVGGRPDKSNVVHGHCLK